MFDKTTTNGYQDKHDLLELLYYSSRDAWFSLMIWLFYLQLAMQSVSFIAMDLDKCIKNKQKIKINKKQQQQQKNK